MSAVDPKEIETVSIFKKGIKGVSNFGLGVLPFEVLEVLEHYGIITPGQKTSGITGLIAGTAVAGGVQNLIGLGLLLAPFELSSELAGAAMQTTGVDALRKDALAHKMLKVGAGFAGAEAAVKMTGGHEVWAEAAKPANIAANLRGVATQARAAASSARAMAANARPVIQQAVQAARQAVPQAAQAVRQYGAPAGGAFAAAVAAGCAGVKAGAATAAAAAANVAAVPVATTAAGAAAAAGVALGAGIAVGAAIHYSGLGKHIYTDAAGEWLGDKVWGFFHGGDEEFHRPLLKQTPPKEQGMPDPRPKVA
jgi:hypothetical protein